MKEHVEGDDQAAPRADTKGQEPHTLAPDYVFRDVYLEGVPVHMDGVRLDWDGGSIGGNDGSDVILRRSNGSSIRNLYFGPSAAQLEAAPLTAFEDLVRGFAHEVLAIDDRGDDFVVVIAGTPRAVDVVVLPTDGLEAEGHTVSLRHALKLAEAVVQERTAEVTPLAVPELVIVAGKWLPIEGCGGVPYWFLTAVAVGEPPVFAERRGDDPWAQLGPRAVLAGQSAAAEALAQHLPPSGAPVEGGV